MSQNMWVVEFVDYNNAGVKYKASAEFETKEEAMKFARGTWMAGCDGVKLTGDSQSVAF